MSILQNHHDLAFADLLQWLLRNGLTAKAYAFDKEAHQEEQAWAVSAASVIGVPAHRAEGRTRAELKQLQDKASASPTGVSHPDRWQSIWSELRNPEQAVRHLDVARVPADAIAFYRGFHFEQCDQWGIYIVVPRLLRYCSDLTRSLGSLKAFEPSVLASLVLFEVFHHEFFHHLVECTATTVEVLWPAPDRAPNPIYLNYRRGSWQAVLGRRADDPLEEALANAYAYNSFSFMSRVQGGYLAGVSRLYQRALERHWACEPPGYRDAAPYVNAGRLDGARMLVERILCTSGECQKLPIRMLVDAVFPSGHTAFWQKPDIPTYLVGTPAELEAFERLVPAPNATYSNLFWQHDTGPLDAFIKTERHKERVARQKSLKLKKPSVP